MIKRIESLSELINQYDGFIIDLWGVIHDGTNLYPHALNAIEKLKEMQKTVIFVSNAPRRAEVVVDILRRLKIPKNLYKQIITSGEIVFESVKKQPGVYSKSGENKYYYIGPERDATLMHGLGYERVRTMDKAAFVVCTGFEDGFEKIEAKTAELKKVLNAGLPLLCANPDISVVKISGEKLLCAGAIAREYEKMGGKVFYFGKPYPDIYESTLTKMGTIAKDRILAIGDGLETDIKGANNAGISSMLVTGGILKVELGLNDGEIPSDEILNKIIADNPKPDFVTSELKF